MQNGEQARLSYSGRNKTLVVLGWGVWWLLEHAKGLLGIGHSLVLGLGVSSMSMLNFKYL